MYLYFSQWGSPQYVLYLQLRPWSKCGQGVTYSTSEAPVKQSRPKLNDSQDRTTLLLHIDRLQDFCRLNFSLQPRPNPDLVLSSTEEHNNCHDDCQYLMHSTHDMHDKLTTELPAMIGGAKVIGAADCNHQQRISM